MKRVDWVVLGVFLTLLAQSQFGLFDKFYDALLVALTLQNEQAWARAVYEVIGKTEFAAQIRAEQPIGFFVVNGVFCVIAAELFSIPVRLIAFGCGSLFSDQALADDEPEPSEPSQSISPTLTPG